MYGGRGYRNKNGVSCGIGINSQFSKFDINRQNLLQISTWKGNKNDQ